MYLSHKVSPTFKEDKEEKRKEEDLDQFFHYCKDLRFTVNITWVLVYYSEGHNTKVFPYINTKIESKMKSVTVWHET